ncbi:MAG: hypothetical protein F6K14_07005 [Symploca sp. SIO2C1]|nr:hypothetical protein [Symploca sp. SIO2C1]
MRSKDSPDRPSNHSAIRQFDERRNATITSAIAAFVGWNVLVGFAEDDW